MMPALVEPSPTLVALDSHLATGRFGDADFLQANTGILYDGLADVVATKLNLARDAIALTADLTPTARVLRRRSLDEAFASLAAADTSGAAGRIKMAQDTLGLQVSTDHDKVGPLTFLRHGKGDPVADNIANTYCRVMARDSFILKPESLAADDDLIAQRALGVLKHLMPDSAFPTFQLASTVVLFSGEIESAYINENPTAFHVNIDRFSDVLILAEALLHESMHQKMADIRLTCNLLASEYDDIVSESAGDVLVPWPDYQRPRLWSFARSLAAQHVYIHLSVMYAGAYEASIQSGSFEGISREDLARRFRTAFERARYLGAANREPIAARNGGADAEHMLDWMDQVTEILTNLEIGGLSIGAIAQAWDPAAVNLNRGAAYLAA